MAAVAAKSNRSTQIIEATLNNFSNNLYHIVWNTYNIANVVHGPRFYLIKGDMRSGEWNEEIYNDEEIGRPSSPHTCRRIEAPVVYENDPFADRDEF